MRRRYVGYVALAVVIAACSPADETAETEPEPTTTTERPLPTSGPPRPDMTLESPAFADGDVIPAKFTCDGADISPELNVISPPSGTASLAIVVDDPDAPVGVWDHWVEYDIPLEGEEDQVWAEDVGPLGVQGVNSWNVPGYGGPCPPEGQDHRYFFTVYALDKELLIPEGVDSNELRSAMDGHILAEAQLMGTYSR